MEQLLKRTNAVQVHLKKEGNQSLGRSRGGLSSKIHASVDKNGNIIWLVSAFTRWVKACIK